MNVIKNKVIPITLTAIILISCICNPTLAYSQNYTIPRVDNTWNYDTPPQWDIMAPVGTFYKGNDPCELRVAYQAENPSNVTLYVIPKQTKISNGYYYYFVGDSPFQPCYNAYCDVPVGYYNFSGSHGYASDATTYDNITLYTSTIDNFDVWGAMPLSNFQLNYPSPYIKMVNSTNDALNDYIYGHPLNPYHIDYSLPAGNVAYLEIADDFDGFNLSCKFPENSSIVGPPWWSITSRYGFADELPTSTTNFNSLTLIDWEKADSGNLFGLTQNAKFDPVGPFVQHKYLVIYNPLYYGGTDNGPYEWIDNPSINISVEAASIKVYALNSSIGPGQSSGSAQVNTITEGYVKDGEINENGNITWSEDGVESTEPITGGSNTPGTAQTIYSFLENIANQLTGFFQGAIGAVNTVVSAISNFVNSLKGLYMWLPGPVYSLLTSAIMIAITIGVIKVFI